ncbi:cation:H+ antiporter [Fodinibius roseus]|uniref:Cation:H+ antiporter n=1 Tax=Fodinibius roseus TaxID=1194090 RepID=A0A1M5CK05_9BACT|nr:calcium/sodium antiporter [Fodinibius roseus]SHF55026.1 cation:H+ antiporter [Fodinibius roseus]
MTILLFVAGLVLLIFGAEMLVRGASKAASALGISPLVVGLTVVAFGTSSPELAVSIGGALSGQADIALGNVIGSNIINVLFILGLSAIIIPLHVSQQVIRFDVPLMIIASVAVLLLSLDQTIDRFDGVLLAAGLILYLGVLVALSLRNHSCKKSSDQGLHANENSKNQINWFATIFLIVAGLALLVLGSRWFVDSAVSFAAYLGVSELIIGLTIVAAGTSMPEVVTSVVAAIRGERDITVGNVVGSNIFNILGVLGLSSVFSPSGIPVSEPVIGFDLPLMIAVAIACLPIFFTRGVISRWEGALFLGYYFAYTLYLVFNATQHDLLSVFNNVMLYFVIPITAVTIIVIVFQEFRKNSNDTS